MLYIDFILKFQGHNTKYIRYSCMHVRYEEYKLVLAMIFISLQWFVQDDGQTDGQKPIYPARFNLSQHRGELSYGYNQGLHLFL